MNKNPKYYIGKYKNIKVIDVVQDFDLTHNLATAVEYLCRAGKKDKNKYLEDIQKAINHLEFELEYERTKLGKDKSYWKNIK
tara:strand:+ start:162 stop:407 length:246 start_codon:yes stop_codon:yes gene_type:complete